MANTSIASEVDTLATYEQKLARLSKWKLHRFYAQFPRVARYLPPTTSLTAESLERYLQTYRTVYIKGSNLHTGRGIIKAWKADQGYRYVRVRGRVEHAATAKELVRRIRMWFPGRMFIVQKAIDLAPLQGRSFDIRVMMMRDGSRRWQYAGMVAKVAGAGSVIANVRRGGGYVLQVEQALRASLHCGSERVEAIKRTLVGLSGEIMRVSEQYPFFSYQCGIDLAVDRNGRVWVIEVNLHNPSHSLFNQLSDKTFYRAIGRLYRSYRSKHKRTI